MLHDLTIIPRGERFAIHCHTCGAERTFIYGPLALLWAESHILCGDPVAVAS